MSPREDSRALMEYQLNFKVRAGPVPTKAGPNHPPTREISMEKRYLIVSADQFALAILDREVLIHFRTAAASLQLIDTELGMRLSPSEARALAQALARKADEAEGVTPQ